MLSVKKIALGVAVIIVLTAVILLTLNIQKITQTENDLGTSTGQEMRSGKNIGDKAIDLSFETFEGDELSLSGFEGKSALVVNAWAGWCPFCIDEIPDLQRASDGFGEEVKVIFVHRTKTESAENGRKYIEDFPVKQGIAITDPVVFDPQDSFYSKYFGFGMPVTVFIDKQGIVKDKKIGQLTKEEIEEKMQALVR